MVSVIVPIYKVEAYLETCIQSICSQTYQDLDIVLVDDGSPDNSGAICDAWAKKDSRIQVIHQKNKGLSGARNTGIAHAFGDYLCFIDSDDWIAPDMIEHLYAMLTTYDADMACCRFAYAYENGVQSSDTSYVTFSVCTPDEYWQKSFDSHTRTYYNVVWNKLYKKELFQDTRFPSGIINEDIHIIFDIFSQCTKIVLSEQIGYYYLQRENSIMNREKTIKHLARPEGYLSWAEKFVLRQQWKFADNALRICIHTLCTEEYGQNWKSSNEYLHLRKRIQNVSKQITRNSKINTKMRFFYMLYNTCEPLARKIYVRHMQKYIF